MHVKVMGAAMDDSELLLTGAAIFIFGFVVGLGFFLVFCKEFLEFCDKNLVTSKTSEGQVQSAEEK